MKLTIELIPTTTWKLNLRSLLRPKDWDKIRKESYELANNVCEICGGVGFFGKGKKKLECHEKWSFDDINKVQKLEGVVALCPICHMCKHIGFHFMQGKEELIKTHLQRINLMSYSKVNQYIAQEFAKHQERSQHEWTLDVTWLKNKELSIK